MSISKVAVKMLSHLVMAGGGAGWTTDTAGCIAGEARRMLRFVDGWRLAPGHQAAGAAGLAPNLTSCPFCTNRAPAQADLDAMRRQLAGSVEYFERDLVAKILPAAVQPPARRLMQAAAAGASNATSASNSTTTAASSSGQPSEASTARRPAPSCTLSR